MALNPSSGWSYYKEIQISDTASVSADYQMKLIVYAGTGDDNTADGIIYCDNHCEDFPNDIRFGTTNDPSTATQLAQWIEESDATSATIWVKCPSDGSNTFYMFVGNPSANQYSNGDDTFLFFDDFDNLDKWTEIETGGKVEDGYLIHDGSSNKCQVRTNSQFESPIAIYVRSKYPGSGLYGYYVRFHTNGGVRHTSGTVGYEFDYDVQGSGKLWALYRENGRTWYTLDTLDGSWDNDFHDYKITIDTDGEIKAYEDGNLKVSTIDTTLASGYVELGSWSTGNLFKYDRIFITKYADPEPTWSSFGSWKTQTTLTDTISLSSSIQKLPSIIYFDIVTTSDDFSTFKQKGKVLTEVVSLLEQLAKRISVVRKDGINLQESIGLRIPLSLVANLSIVDIFSHIRRRQKLLSTAITLADSISLGLAKYLVESIVLSDLLSLLPKLFGNLKINTKNYSFAVWCSSWKEDNYSIVVEFIADKDSRDKLISDIVPGAVAQLYNILGEPKFIDTTYEGKNTITLTPRRGLSTLKDQVTVAVKRYTETMLRWDLFKIKLEVVRL